MTNPINSAWTQRPSVQRVKYTTEPKYYSHQSYEDKLAILVCQIKIWQPKEHDWFNVPTADNCLTIRECESIEITDSCKELMGKAVVKFPRGTVISLSKKKNKAIAIRDSLTNTALQLSLKDVTMDGDVMTPNAYLFKDDKTSTTSMAVNYDDKGLIDFNRTKTEPALLSPNDVAIGNRIEIRLGYAYSESEFNEMNAADKDDRLPVMFTGFITSISVNTPLQLECTNMAHVLSCISTPNISARAVLSVKDFLDENGKYHLLKDTGIELSEHSKGLDISVSGGTISENLTVYDVLAQWNKAGILCMMDLQSDGKVKLRVGLSYYAGKGGGALPNNDKKYITYNGGNDSVLFIQFDWDVAEDKLTLKNNDKKYLAIEAHARTSANQIYKLTVRKNPDDDDDGWLTDKNGDFQVVNNRKVEPRKKAKIINGTTSTKKLSSKIKDKVGLDKYTVIPYFSQKIDISEKELIEEAKQFWAKYNANGISGSLTIFGDLPIRPTEIVGLIDPRNPEKDGYYYVESVNTSFGIGGYRKELTIPYKIASFSKPVEII